MMSDDLMVPAMDGRCLAVNPPPSRGTYGTADSSCGVAADSDSCCAAEDSGNW